ncbi:MAG TPA: FMN-dependent dehydrogenase, partial [Eubacterium sp.]|nr:FMN-dependent dehydrogenase [Eubacterium sp.]
MEHKRNQDANLINEKYIESLVVEQRIIDSVKPSLKTNYFGSEFDMPILTPAFSHIGNINGREKTGLYEYSVAARNLNMLNFVGMMENEGFKDIMDAGAKT